MKRRQYHLLFIILILLISLACSTLSQSFIGSDPTEREDGLLTPSAQTGSTATGEISPSATASPAAIPTPNSITPASASPTPVALRFAVIGDYGSGDQHAADVATLVKSWNPDFIITVGDNNYPSGAPETIDQNIGQFYHEFIYPYRGGYGSGAEKLRFFPTLGNHDVDFNQGQAYLDYFELPGNERYYDFVEGPVQFFALNTDSREPDGVGRSSLQANWLREHLAASAATWKIVYGHVPPYTSSLNGPVDWMIWPFKEWGATIYLCGHAHFYERLEVGGMPYIINGLGGGAIYDIGAPAEGSLVRFNDDYGAILVIADERQITFQFITRAGLLVDEYRITQSQP